MASMAKRSAFFEPYRSASLLFCALALSVACSASRPPVPHPGDTPEDDPVVDAGGAKKPSVNACPPSNPYCKRDTAPTTPTCATVPVDLTPVGVNVMIAVEGAASMQKHWPIVQSAVKKM